MEKVKKKRKSMSDKYDSDDHQFDQLDKDDNPNGKKRFVWPESLHKDFIAAVFDIGMKNSIYLLSMLSMLCIQLFSITSKLLQWELLFC